MLAETPKTQNDIADRREDEARQALTDAQEEFRASFMKFIGAAIDYGSVTGWKQGFDQGWDAAFDYLRTPMSEMKAEAIKRFELDRPTQVPLPFLSLTPDSEPQSAADLVLEFIKMNPGKRGVEIAQALEARTPSIPERTVRTALHRLRHQAEKIKNVDGKWYAADYDTLRRI